MNQIDALPKCICIACWEKIEEFHRFHRTVRCAQEEYLRQIVKCEDDNETENITNEITEQPNFVEVITNCDGLGFSDDYTTKPDELDDIDNKEIKSSELTDVLCNDDTKIENDQEETGKFRLFTIPIEYYFQNSCTSVINFFFITESECDSISSKSNDVDPMQSREIFMQNFDTTCDLCSIELKSLKRAISHYRNEHQNHEGYIKCCGLKIKSDKLVNDHIRWHINPEIFK